LRRIYLILLLAGCSKPEPPPTPEVKEAPAADARRQTTRGGLYVVSIRPLVLPIPLREVHAWAMEVETPTGRPVFADRIDIEGGMPDHGHGLPTRPKVERGFGPGAWRIEGLKFNMEGRWRLGLRVRASQGVDDASFELDLKDGGGPGLTDDAYLRLVRSLSLDALGPMPADPSNRVSRDPRAVELGRRLFFDRGLSRGGRVACASCHEPERFFTDGRARAEGLAEVARNSPTLVGSGHGQWFTWDGRRDSLWAQALTPIESAAEMGFTRVEAVRFVAAHPSYGPAYAAIFGPLPRAARRAEGPERAGPFGDAAAKAAWAGLDRPTKDAYDAAYANLGKTLGAFQRTLSPTPSRFDRYARALLRGDPAADQLLTHDERAGLRLFIDDGRTQCLRCHNGPLFTNFGFHNTGTGSTKPPHYDLGRSVGLRAARLDPFNCEGPFSDAPANACAALRFADLNHTGGLLRGAFKVPTLRNVADTSPYLHDGRFETLEQVIAHYREPAPPTTSRHELARVRLTDQEARQLVAFLRTLTSDQRPPAG